MILVTDELRERLLANGAVARETDHVPVLKLFNPCGAATWIVTEMMADGDTSASRTLDSVVLSLAIARWPRSRASNSHSVS